MSCIFKPPSEESINYNATTERVYIDFSEGILMYQKAIAAIIIALGLFLMVNAFCFFTCTYCIVHTFKKMIPKHISTLSAQKQRI